MGLRLQRAARLELLAHPAHSGNTLAEAAGRRGRALALVIKFEDAVVDRHRDRSHCAALAATSTSTLQYLWNGLNQHFLKCLVCYPVSYGRWAAYIPSRTSSFSSAIWNSCKSAGDGR